MSTAYQELLQEFVPRPVTSKAAHRRALKQVEQLADKPKKSRAEQDMLKLLTTLVESYETRHAKPAVSPRERLAELIEAHGLTQVGLSRESQVPRSTINAILAGKRSISKANAWRLSRYFGLPLEEFIAAG